MSRSGNRAILRKIRQNDRAVQAQAFSKSFVNDEAKRRWIIFGGDIKYFKLDAQNVTTERPKRIQRAIRRWKRINRNKQILAKVNP